MAFSVLRRTRLLLVAIFLTVCILFIAHPERQPWEVGHSLSSHKPEDDGPPVGSPIPIKVHDDRLRSHAPDPQRVEQEAEQKPEAAAEQKPEQEAEQKPEHDGKQEGQQEGQQGGEEEEKRVEFAEKPLVAEDSTTKAAPAETTSTTSSATPLATCMGFEQWQHTRPGPNSEGKRQFPYVRPPPACRTFPLPAMESLLERMKGIMPDPDLFRLFENSYPNTLDTMVKWRGYAKKVDEETKQEVETDEELAYIITGDIDAMWLRDSASQIYSYLPLLEASSSPDSLASLWRGLINSHARYITISPYCHSFQPPPESGIPPTKNGAYKHNNPQPAYNPEKVFDCKWELDSLASFLQVSSAYYKRTGDAAFFGKHHWVRAVAAAVDAAGAMRKGTYADDGKVLSSAWTFTGWTNRGSETLTNDGLGNPVRENGMVRSAFRPSDDACIFQLLVPANMMWAKYLEEASLIMEQLEAADASGTTQKLTLAMREQAAGIRAGIDRDAVVHHRDFGDIFAYEVDGFGGANLMDDANIPSLLAMPLWNYTAASYAGGPSPPRDYAAVYQNTRRFVMSDANPYWSKGPVLSAVGGPHLGPGRGWPMAAIVAGLTAYDDLSGLDAAAAGQAVEQQLRQVLDSTAGTGVIHESVNGFDDRQWTRSWFGWANGLFGELVLRIADQEAKGGKKSVKLLEKSWQSSA